MLAILTTHPIQYQVPLWQALAKEDRLRFEVWYLTDHGTRPSRDREFGQTFAWDLDTLAGYPFRFLKVASGATPTSFLGCRLQERLRDRLRETESTALWIQGWQVFAYWQAVREAQAAGVEVWLRGESNDLAPRRWWKECVRRAVLGPYFRRIDRFLCIGTANRRLYERFGNPVSRMVPAPYAVDNERFERQAAALRSARRELRRNWGIDEDAYCVLFAGKFIDKKRPWDVIEAAGLLRDSGRMPNLHLLFVGSGELGSALRSACQVVHDAEGDRGWDKSSRDAVRRPKATFAGFLNQVDISRAYVAADCLVLPSDHRETWGLVVNEALASGLPCVVSSACGCAEDLAVYPGECCQFEFANPQSLAESIVSVAGRRLSDRTRRAILEHHSFQTTVNRICELAGVRGTADTCQLRQPVSL
jgi:glycosyltransferase involved in cell wall biosynthesis